MKEGYLPLTTSNGAKKEKKSIIHGIGTDIVHIPRITKLSEKYGHKFYKKFLHPTEIEYLNGITCKTRKEQYIASRWCAKEAAYKAFRSGRIPFYDFRISTNDDGSPSLIFEGLAKEISKQNDITKAHISISHDTEYATSFVILEKELKNESHEY